MLGVEQSQNGTLLMLTVPIKNSTRDLSKIWQKQDYRFMYVGPKSWYPTDIKCLLKQNLLVSFNSLKWQCTVVCLQETPNTFSSLLLSDEDYFTDWKTMYRAIPPPNNLK